MTSVRPVSFPTGVFFVALVYMPVAAGAQTASGTTSAAMDNAGDGSEAAAAPPATATRPVIKTNRWQEDWSVLADPALRTEPFDSLKYIPLSASDPNAYLSLGATLRERLETNHDPAFGTSDAAADSYMLQRLQVHADLHFNSDWRFFTQLEDVRAFGKKDVGPADENRLDLRLAFLEYDHDLGDGKLMARAGRQDFAFDLQRFVSSRDGPNVRQSFDALWANWETGPWRIIGFVSQPVQYFDRAPFDDDSDKNFQFHTLRIERQVFGTDELSAYYSYYERDNARFLDAAGSESRHVLDIRFAGTAGNFDWDTEAMGQTGEVGDSDVLAWGLGARAGYTFADATWTPRLGLQFDAASGDRHPGDGDLETFNPLFPNGYYFTLAGYTGYSNLIHFKPSITVQPTEKLTVTAAGGFQWRQTTSDAVYTQPSIPVAGTAGKGERWTGAYAQLRADYAFNANAKGALELVRYEAGDTIRDAGGDDSTYLGAEMKFSW